MGARLSDPRWFRTVSMRDEWFLIRIEGDDWIDHRWHRLDFCLSLGPLAINTLLEYWRLSDERKERDRQRMIRERCPICGGWRQLGAASMARQRRHPTLGMIACCRDCGWPHAENIKGSNVVVHNPRTAYKLNSPDGRF